MTGPQGPGDRFGQGHLGELLRLVGEATVGIRALPGPGGAGRGKGWGSGFLVAPGWVLTCAHVLVHSDGRRRGTGRDEDIGVVVGSRVVRGRLAYHLAGESAAVPARWDDGTDSEPYPRAAMGIHPDLALIRLLEDVPDQSCVWLTDRTWVPIGDAHIFGRQDDSDDDPAAGPWEIDCRLAGQDRGQFLLNAAARPRPGVSGGPLVDMERGEVAGVVKARGREGTTTVLAVPMSALRALSAAHHVPGAPDLGPAPYDTLMRLHDRWHADRQRPGGGTARTWADVQKHLPAVAHGRSALDRLRALELLASLPSPRHAGQVERIAAEAMGAAGRIWPQPLPTWRDGHGVLYDPDPGRESRMTLRYLLFAAAEAERTARDAEDAAGLGHAERLREWAEERARDLDVDERDALGREERRLPSSVLVEFEPRAYDEGTPVFDWAIRLGWGAGEWTIASVGNDDPRGFPFDYAVRMVERGLREVLDGADGPGGTPARLEVALPDERLGTAAHRWLVAQKRAVGLGRAVVVRDVGRRGVPDPRWEARWRRLTGADRLQPLRLARAGSVLGRHEIDAGADGAVPVLCLAVGDGPGSDAAGVTLESGYAVAVWRADGHPPERCAEDCDLFHSRITALLDGGTNGAAGNGALRELPGKLGQLREAAKDGTTGAGWVAQVILLYDDPGNPLPQLLGPPVHFPAL
ncbi:MULTISPECIES: trypsin-like peptidase domain-containing protein [unclassified Streptomyces]|uniref:VMAP-C domain-containing protein n=1 Tax=unclassified Streptomyces TaxID=2593676 RepID=UPI00380210A5